MSLLLTFGAALAGGLLLLRARVPGGMMVGAIAAVTALSLTTGMAHMPVQAKVTAQCLAGAFIACGIGQKELHQLPKLWKPLLTLLGCLLGVNLLAGWLIWRCSPLDPLTAMLCAVPGGMSDIPIIAADMGADAGKVAILQFVRMSAGIGLFPSLILLLAKAPPEPPEEAGPQEGGQEQTGPAAFPLTLVAAFPCGILGRLSGVPAGTLVFSMLGVIALKLLGGPVRLPMWCKRLAQVLSGAYIGCGITRKDLGELRYLILPAGIVLGCYFLNSLLTGRLLRRLFGFPLRTAMLIATPAGASDMALISSDLGVEDRQVIELQIIRMVIVISVFPQLISLVCTRMG